MSSPPLIVIDTNVVLDLFIFSDTQARPCLLYTSPSPRD